MSLPAVDPAVAAEAVAALPARLRKRLDEVVAQVGSWTVESSGDGVTVRPDGQVSITLRAPVVTAEDAVCSCLLAPRCLHRAAVLNAAPVWAGVAPASDESDAAHESGASVEAGSEAAAGSEETGNSAGANSETAPGREMAAGGRAVSAGQDEAARGLWAATAAVLANGMPGAGAVAQADLLRAIHQARATGLHGPAAAAIRVVERIRAGRREDSAFRLGDLTDDLREVLVACHRLADGDGTVAGTARRDYEPVGDLRLFGLFCEPVRAATGHSGAATYLVDERGRLWVISDVRPAEQPATGSAVRASVDLGDVRLSHHALARAGLRAINAHASAAGRLSHGRARQAVSATGTGWFEPPLDTLWRVGPAEQADRWLTGTTLPAQDRPMPHDLAFLDGVILGADRRGLLLAVDGHDQAVEGHDQAVEGHDQAVDGRGLTADGLGLTVAVGAPHEDPALPYVANLRLLATRAAGRRIRLIGRFTGARRVDGLAFAAGWLPESHGGHVDLGATALTRTDIPDADAARPAADEDTDATAGPPLHLLRHQVERVAAAGRVVLLSGVDDDARRLGAAHLGTAATVLTALGAAGSRRTRDVFGRLDPHDADRLARAWLAAAVYEHAARRAVTRQAWRE